MRWRCALHHVQPADVHVASCRAAVGLHVQVAVIRADDGAAHGIPRVQLRLQPGRAGTAIGEKATAAPKCDTHGYAFRLAVCGPHLPMCR